MSPRKRFTIYDSLNQSGVLGFGFNPKLEIRNARAKSWPTRPLAVRLLEGRPRPWALVLSATLVRLQSSR